MALGKQLSVKLILVAQVVYKREVAILGVVSSTMRTSGLPLGNRLPTDTKIFRYKFLSICILHIHILDGLVTFYRYFNSGRIESTLNHAAVRLQITPCTTVK